MKRGRRIARIIGMRILETFSLNTTPTESYKRLFRDFTLEKADPAYMVFIIKRGELPRTPHTEFYARDGVLSLEEIHGVYGFSGPWSRKLHLRSYPTAQVAFPTRASFDLTPSTPKEADVLEPYHILTRDIPYDGDPMVGKRSIVFGSSTIASVCKPTRSMEEGVFFRNGEMHELYFVQEGHGVLHSEYGDLPIRKDTYINVPKGTTYNVELKSETAWFLIIESIYPITFAPHYMNEGGQATLMSPVVETEIEAPELQSPLDKKGDFPIYIKHKGGKVTKVTLGHHPFDVVGWEGALYPFVFDIMNHHAIAREIHTAPPVHQTFQAGNVPNNGISICSFVPQIEGWHPKDVPAPYSHYNVDSDECMFFCNAAYGARKGVIQEGSFTLHPGSLPHSPQGNAALRSLAARGTMSSRLAVMFDTYFESMSIADTGWKYRDKEYALKWDESRWEAEMEKGEGYESPSQ